MEGRRDITVTVTVTELDDEGRPKPGGSKSKRQYTEEFHPRRDDRTDHGVR